MPLKDILVHLDATEQAETRLRLAADLARERAGLPADAELRRWPQVRPADRLSPPRSSEDRAAAVARPADWWAGWGGFAGVAARLGLPPEGPLTLPPLRLG